MIAMVREVEVQGQNAKPPRLQGASGPPKAVVAVELARLEGFEPPTNGFGSRYSIRLSYRRAAGYCDRIGGAVRAPVACVAVRAPRWALDRIGAVACELRECPTGAWMATCRVCSVGGGPIRTSPWRPIRA